MILSEETLPCENFGKDPGTIKPTDERIDIIHKMLYFWQKSSRPIYLYQTFLSNQIDDFNLPMIEAVMTAHSKKLFMGKVMK